MSNSVKPENPDPNSIVIFRALQLGDMLNVVPALGAVRAAFPAAQITLVGLPWPTAFVKRLGSCLDGVISFPGFPGLPEQTADMGHLSSFLTTMQTLSFDLAIQLHGASGISNPLVCLWGAERVAGFYVRGQYCPDERYVMEYPEGECEAWGHLRLMEFLGILMKGDELEFPLFEDDWQAFRRLEEDHGLQKRYVCIQPGARAIAWRWPGARFAQVADQLAARGYQAELLVSNDTGVSHLAAALKTPSVVLFAAPDLERWAPKDRRLHKALPHSLTRTPEDVLVPAERLLEEVAAHVC